MSIQKVSSFQDEGGKLKAVASGTLPNGKPVVVNADGTVSVVDPAAVSVSQSAGSPVVFDTTASKNTSAAYDEIAQKVVIAYEDDNNLDYGTAVVGTVSGTSISFGTPVVFESADSVQIKTVYDSANQKIIIVYRDNGNTGRGTAIVGTVSGTSISFGTPVVFETGSTSYISATYDSNSQKIVIAYWDGGNSNYGTAVVGSVSGTSISFGTPVVFESATTEFTSIAYDSSNNKVVIAYMDGGNSSYGTAIVGTVSGTSISFGSAVVFASSNTSGSGRSIVYDSSAQKVVIAYEDAGNSSYGTAVVGTVSGTSISFGSPVVFESAYAAYINAVYDVAAAKIVISYRDVGNSDNGTIISGTVSGTSISFDTPLVFETGQTNWIGVAYDSTQKKVVVSYQDNGNSAYGTAVVFQTGYEATNLTAENYIGISTGGAVADTGNATVDIIGSMNDAQTGLTAGQAYYVQADGTLSTTADDPSVFAGTAISGTTILVKS